MVKQRLKREKGTISAMLSIYCISHHDNNDTLCPDCLELQEYAFARLDRCPFQEKKTTCANCLIHCYKPDNRVRMKEIMGFSGPKMMRKHPYLAIMHIVDGFRKPRDLSNAK